MLDLLVGSEWMTSGTIFFAGLPMHSSIVSRVVLTYWAISLNKSHAYSILVPRLFHSSSCYYIFHSYTSLLVLTNLKCNAGFFCFRIFCLQKVCSSRTRSTIKKVIHLKNSVTISSLRRHEILFNIFLRFGSHVLPRSLRGTSTTQLQGRRRAAITGKRRSILAQCKEDGDEQSNTGYE